MDEKKDYVVTDVAGSRPDIAGKRRTVGETISLTDSQAQFEVSRGTVQAVADPKASEANPPAAGGTLPVKENVDETLNSPMPDGLGAAGPIGGTPGVEPEAEADAADVDRVAVSAEEKAAEDKAPKSRR